MVGGGKTRNKSLFSGQTVVSIAAAYEAAGTNRYDEIMSPGKGLPLGDQMDHGQKASIAISLAEE